MKRLLAAGICLAAMSLAVPAFAENLPNADDVSGKITFYTHWTNYIDDGSFDKWEAEFKKPVVTTNQALIWAMLRQFEAKSGLGGLGTLLEEVPAG